MATIAAFIEQINDIFEEKNALMKRGSIAKVSAIF